MTARPRHTEPSSDEQCAVPDNKAAPTTRHLAHLMRQHDKLARLAVEQGSHKLPEYADTIGLLAVVETELQERYPHAYDALLPVWLTRNTYVRTRTRPAQPGLHPLRRPPGRPPRGHRRLTPSTLHNPAAARRVRPGTSGEDPAHRHHPGGGGRRFAVLGGGVTRRTDRAAPTGDVPAQAGRAPRASLPDRAALAGPAVTLD